MSLKKRLLTTLVAGTLSAAATSAYAVPFTGVIVFGDSLSDAGAYRPGLTALVGAQAAAGLGRFTTNPGPVWAGIDRTNLQRQCCTVQCWWHQLCAKVECAWCCPRLHLCSDLAAHSAPFPRRSPSI